MHITKTNLFSCLFFFSKSIFRTPRFYTYPSRSDPYVLRGLPSNYYVDEIHHLDALDLFNSNQHIDIYRDNDDEDIFV